MRVSPRKVRLVTDLIKGKDLAEAQQILDYNDKAAARVVGKLLASAAANAENNNGISPDNLFVLRAYADEGPTLKRFRPRALGRATRINKRTSHVTIVLEEREPGKAAKKRRVFRRPRKAEKAEEATTEETLSEEEELEEAEEKELLQEAEAEAAEEEEAEGEPEEPGAGEEEGGEPREEGKD